MIFFKKYCASYCDDRDSDYERDRRAKRFDAAEQCDDSGKPEGPKAHGLDHMMGTLGIEKGLLSKFYDFVIGPCQLL